MREVTDCIKSGEYQYAILFKHIIIRSMYIVISKSNIYKFYYMEIMETTAAITDTTKVNNEIIKVITKRLLFCLVSFSRSFCKYSRIFNCCSTEFLVLSNKSYWLSLFPYGLRYDIYAHSFGTL